MARRGRAFVINLDDKGGNGTHWTAARLVGNTLYYADPFGTLLNGWPPAEFDSLGAKQVVNTITFQRPKSVLCGYYAMLFAKAMDTIKDKIGRKEFEKILYQAII